MARDPVCGMYVDEAHVAFIPVAAGAPRSFGIEMNPIFAAAAIAFSTISVVSNSLLLRRFRSEV